MIFNQLVDDIREESCLWSLKHKPKAEDQEDAWRRIAGKNKMTSIEVKLIFRELSKKYKEERKKPKSTWKLLQSLSFLDEDIDAEKLKSTPGKTTAEEPEIPAQLSNEQLEADTVTPKEEPSKQLVNAPNTSDEDIYVELLEVGDEEDFSENDDPPSKTKANAKPAQPPPQQVSIKQNHNLSVLKPAMLNNSLLKNFSSVSTTPTSSTKTSVTASMTARKTPLVFSGLKRKLANGAESKLNGFERLHPPEKQNKIATQEKNELAKGVTTTSSAQSSPALNLQKDNAPPTVPGKSSPNQSCSSAADIDMSPTQVMAIESANMNIGNVIPMPEIQKIKLETTDDPSTLIENAAFRGCGEIASTNGIQTTPHSRMYDSFGQYVSNTLNTLPAHLANRLELKILEAIIAINTEKSNLV